MPDCHSSKNYFFETQHQLNFFPQESNKIGFVFTGKTHTQKKKVFLEFWDTSRWLHFDLLLVQMHFYTTSVS